MKVTSRKVLGIAFDERSAVVAEVRMAHGDRVVERQAEFVFPEGVSWDDPVPLGKAFGQFLRQQEHFSAKRAVVGLPANWLIARGVSVPPATPETTTGLVRLQAEQEFASELTELAIDYADVGDR